MYGNEWIAGFCTVEYGVEHEVNVFSFFWRIVWEANMMHKLELEAKLNVTKFDVELCFQGEKKGCIEIALRAWNMHGRLMSVFIYWVSMR